jgi:dTDP-glucose 4,6-dehydratase
MKKGITGEIYHISSTKMISVKELVKKICILVNKNFQNNIIITKERIGEDRYYNISSKKIRKELSWKEEFSLDLGLTLTYKWVYDNFNFLKNQKLIYFHKK